MTGVQTCALPILASIFKKKSYNIDILDSLEKFNNDEKPLIVGVSEIDLPYLAEKIGISKYNYISYLAKKKGISKTHRYNILAICLLISLSLNLLLLIKEQQFIKNLLVENPGEKQVVQKLVEKLEEKQVPGEKTVEKSVDNLTEKSVDDNLTEKPVEQKIEEKPVVQKPDEKAIYYLPEELWSSCNYTHNGEPILDMSASYWCNLTIEDQIKYATAYQAGYAKAKGIEVEKTIRKNGANFVFRLIPPGRFWMGSQGNESGRVVNEGRNQVVISKPYYVGKTEVTQAQWWAIMGNSSSYQGNNPSYWKGNCLPVENVSWDNCKSFCDKSGFRMLTEAQWEYACRAGSTREFNIGENINPDIVNYDGNYPYMGPKNGMYRKKTVECGSLNNKNSFGLYDMHGNVSEFCSDYYEMYYPIEDVDPEVTKGSSRIVRGGSWAESLQKCRSAFRCYTGGRSECNQGFRVLVTLN